MAPQTSIEEAQQALAYLLNQDSMPNNQSARWAFFITSAVQRLYRSFNFEPAKTSTTLTTDSTGRVSLATLKLGPVPMIEAIETGIQGYGLSFEPRSNYALFSQGDNRYSIERDAAGVYWLYTTEPDTELTFRYFEAPELTGSNRAVFTKMVIGKGALIYYRQAEDPEADTSVEEDQFRQEVAEMIEAQNRNAPQQFARTARDVRGHRTGAN